jgi:hypothetical protein
MSLRQRVHAPAAIPRKESTGSMLDDASSSEDESTPTAAESAAHGNNFSNCKYTGILFS